MSGLGKYGTGGYGRIGVYRVNTIVFYADHISQITCNFPWWSCWFFLLKLDKNFIFGFLCLIKPDSDRITTPEPLISQNMGYHTIYVSHLGFLSPTSIGFLGPESPNFDPNHTYLKNRLYYPTQLNSIVTDAKGRTGLSWPFVTPLLHYGTGLSHDLVTDTSTDLCIDY